MSRRFRPPAAGCEESIIPPLTTEDTENTEEEIGPCGGRSSVMASSGTLLPGALREGPTLGPVGCQAQEHGIQLGPDSYQLRRDPALEMPFRAGLFQQVV